MWDTANGSARCRRRHQLVLQCILVNTFASEPFVPVRCQEPHKQLTVKQAWIGVMEQMPWCAHNTLSGLGPGSALSRGVVDLSGAWTEAGNDASSM